MAELLGGDFPTLAAPQEPTPDAGEGQNLGGEPTAPKTMPCASGEAIAGTEAPGLSPPDKGPGSSKDLVSSEAGALDKKGKSIMDDIIALKLEQKAARRKEDSA